VYISTLKEEVERLTFVNKEILETKY